MVGNTAGTRRYSDYNRKRLRVACIRLGINQNSSRLQEVYDRLDNWDEDNAPDVAHNHVRDADLAKEIMDPKNKHRRKDMAMVYLEAKEESEGEEVGEAGQPGESGDDTDNQRRP
jgi:hypothetical protein